MGNALPTTFETLTPPIALPLSYDDILARLAERFGKTPDMEGLLFLIGMNEFGHPPRRNKFSKEEKQDLMHIAVCHLLSRRGYYHLAGHDDDGWPHYEQLLPVEEQGLEKQESLLKECMVEYFNESL